MNDLLEDSLTSEGGTNVGELTKVEEDVDTGVSHAPDAASDNTLSEFFKEVGDLKNDMARIQKSIHKLQDAQSETKTIAKASGMNELKKRMEADIDDVTLAAQRVKVKLEALDKANIANRKKSGCGEGSSTDRSRMSITVTLKKKLKEVMQAFQALRQSFQDEYREVVERRIFTVTGKKADEETVDHLIETGESELIFKKAIQQLGRGQILDTIGEIQERHEAVKDIERKLFDLHQIFLDMAVLVESQGEMLDNIESQVSKAVDHVQSGTAALQKVKKLQRGTRKWMCIAIILLLIIIAIIVVAVLQPWKNKNV
ncbi:hypothetical protein O6H91_06G022800 [Diphasiastrum complanatum]|uniref:Uncharacterized protein n=2 Tax=Diphasiastrum complanatum TaxID=34168 RepID=A0ACC2DCE7_DIPCM|nr:hypothetical protein O6H91_06G022800 [Diphasiastrum complanatum]KAJ7551642.1 hypothetical protein O6H91_06G022800 [Diphasiastrum complanatum]